jgi:tubulin-specific chaperone A
MGYADNFLSYQLSVTAQRLSIYTQRRMLEESNKMITDSSERLGKAAEDLRNLITAAMKEPDVADSTQLAQAKEVLEEISA